MAIVVSAAASFMTSPFVVPKRRVAVVCECIRIFEIEKRRLYPARSALPCISAGIERRRAARDRIRDHARTAACQREAERAVARVEPQVAIRRGTDERLAVRRGRT